MPTGSVATQTLPIRCDDLHCFVLEDAEVYLGDREVHREQDGEVIMPMLLCVRAMLLGYAIECGLKALWVRKGNKLVRDGRYQGVTGANDHDLPQLAQAVGFVPTTAEAEVLRRLSQFSRFAGRYPVARAARATLAGLALRSHGPGRRTWRCSRRPPERS